MKDGRIGTYYLAADISTLSPLLGMYISVGYAVLLPAGDSYLMDEGFGIGDIRAPDDEVCC